ncbi:amidohydrolase family protein [Nocardioides houyundeii]|uniref:amidohydrolase family protein n=1 Tax=Nocardioides houyundeii TaxID=2045452 RepID=UPI000DF11DB0|nr:amidohydrolase family protein [Nocardioides houyundeii]
MRRLVISGGLVLTGPRWRPEPLDLLVVDGRIASVSAPGSFAEVDAERHDATGALVIPGLVNGHTHSHTRHARGANRDWTLETSLLHGPWLAAGLDGERGLELAELSATLTAVELLRSGCTGAFDLVAQAGLPDFERLSAVAGGYHGAGMRAVIAPMVADRSVHAAVPAIDGCCPPPPAGPSTDLVLAACRDWATYAPALPGISPALAPTIAAHCTPELITGLHALAREQGLRLHTHLAESLPQAASGEDRFGRSITAELGDLGVLDHHLTVAHAIWVDAADLALLAEAGAVAVTVPGSNLRLGSGVADTRAMLDAGIRLAVGTDGANSSDAYDQLDAARLAALLSRVGSRSPGGWLSVEETLSAATEGGAAACGWTETGRLAPDHAADLALLDLGSSAFRPANDVPNQLLTAARAADVTDVFVAGRRVIADRAAVRVDVAAAESRFSELVAELHERHAPARRRGADEAAASAAALAALRARPRGDARLLPATSPLADPTPGPTPGENRRPSP